MSHTQQGENKVSGETPVRRWPGFGGARGTPQQGFLLCNRLHTVADFGLHLLVVVIAVSDATT